MRACDRVCATRHRERALGADTAGISETTRGMAEGQVQELGEKPLEELQKNITCTACKGIYEQAKVLPCHHYYCTSCIEEMVARSEGKPFECPECQKKTNLPPSGVTGLQPALFVERMKDAYSKMAKAEGKDEAVCEQCGAAKSVAFCCHCADFICDDCVAIHEKLKAFPSHAVLSLEDMKKGGIQNIPVSDPSPGKCAEHDKNLKLLCFDCNRLICRDCTLFEHCGHKFEFLTKCASESRNTLRESLAPLQKIQADIEAAEKIVVSEETKIERQKEEACNAIQQSFEQLKALLDERKAELVEKARTMAQEKDALVAQLKVLQGAYKEIQVLVELVKRNIESTRDHDLISIRTQLLSKMEEEEKCHQQLPLELKTTADLSWHLPSPDIVPKEIGHVYDQLSPPTLFNMTSFEKGCPARILLSAPTASQKDIFANLTCVANPSSLSAGGEVVQICGGVFRLSITPRERGRHDLAVKIKGKHVATSPFRVFVQLPPCLLSKQWPRVISYHTSPWGIAINNKQQLVVAEIHGKRVTVVDKSGKEVRKFEDYQLKDPRGVAAASDGTIYLTDSYAQQLFTLTPRGVQSNRSRESWVPFSIKIINNQLYVTNPQNDQINVFDMDYNQLGTIETKQVPRPIDIAKGPDGLYVAGGKMIGVYKCEPNGVFIRHLSLTPSSLNLSSFHGLCFDASGHIVATSGENDVYVFRTNGECIGHVAGISDFSVGGLTVDEDGFVYVSNTKHHGKISAF